MFIIVTFLDAAQLSWVRENLKLLPVWPAIFERNGAKKCSPPHFGGLTGRFQDSQNLAQPLPHLLQLSLASVRDGKWQR